MADTLLEIENLTIKYGTEAGAISAVTNASFSIEAGKYSGLVGESGCGKSTIAKAIIGGLDDNGRITDGKIKFRGQEIQDMSQRELSESVRWTEISLIPQSAMNSLDPLHRIDDQAVELARVHTDMTKQEARDRLRELFGIVGLQESRISDYPHQFSGGMQQRAIIAFALLLDPSLIIADEPTTALDVIMQDQVFAYLDKIREETDTSMLLITHDISVVLESCGQITVMHAGQVCETGPSVDLYETPRHPYLILLQNAFPDIRNPKQELTEIEGQPPQLMDDVDYCTFVDRCPWAVDECRANAPPLELVEGSTEHRAACVRADEGLHAQYEAEQVGVGDDDD